MSKATSGNRPLMRTSAANGLGSVSDRGFEEQQGGTERQEEGGTERQDEGVNFPLPVGREVPLPAALLPPSAPSLPQSIPDDNSSTISPRARKTPQPATIDIGERSRDTKTTRSSREEEERPRQTSINVRDQPLVEGTILPLPQDATIPSPESMKRGEQVPMFLTFKDAATEFSFNEFQWQQHGVTMLIGAVVLAVQYLYWPIAASIALGGSGGTAIVFLVLMWTMWTSRLALVVFAFLGMYFKVKFVRKHWSIIVSLLPLLYVDVVILASYQCGTNSSSDVEVSSCPDYSNSYLPFAPFYLALINPWILAFLFRGRWHHMFLVSLTQIVCAGVFAFEPPADPTFSVPAWILLLIMLGIAVVAAYSNEKMTRLSYRMHLSLLNQISIIKKAVSSRKQAEAKAKKLGDYMDISSQIIFEFEVVELSPPFPPSASTHHQPSEKTSSPPATALLPPTPPSSAPRPPPLRYKQPEVDLIYTYASTAATTLLGQAPNALLQESIFNTIHPEDHQIVQEAFRAAATHPGTQMICRFRQLVHHSRTTITTTPLVSCPQISGGSKEGNLGETLHQTNSKQQLQKHQRQRTSTESQHFFADDNVTPPPSIIWVELLGHLEFEKSSLIAFMNRHRLEKSHVSEATKSTLSFIAAEQGRRIEDDNTVAADVTLAAHERGSSAASLFIPTSTPQNHHYPPIAAANEETETFSHLRDEHNPKAAAGSTTLLLAPHSPASELSPIPLLPRLWPKVVSIVGSERDISHEKAVQDQLEAENENRLVAQSAIAASEKSFAYAAHEIRNPLHSIGATVEVLADSISSLNDETAKKDFAALVVAVQGVRRLVDEILDTTKLRSGNVTVSLENVNMRQLCTDLALQYQSFASVPITVQIEPQVPFLLLSDALRIRQCAANALTNSCKHTLEGCIQIIVSTRIGLVPSSEQMDTSVNASPPVGSLLPPPLPSTAAATATLSSGHGIVARQQSAGEASASATTSTISSNVSTIPVQNLDDSKVHEEEGEEEGEESQESATATAAVGAGAGGGGGGEEMQEGLEITQEKPMVPPVIYEPKTILRLEIVDTGTGLKGKDPESLFGEFHPHIAREEGTGLGLSIVRRIVTALHGKCGILEEVREVPQIFEGSRRGCGPKGKRALELLRAPSSLLKSIISTASPGVFSIGGVRSSSSSPGNGKTPPRDNPPTTYSSSTTSPLLRESTQRPQAHASQQFAGEQQQHTTQPHDVIVSPMHRLASPGGVGALTIPSSGRRPSTIPAGATVAPPGNIWLNWTDPFLLNARGEYEGLQLISRSGTAGTTRGTEANGGPVHILLPGNKHRRLCTVFWFEIPISAGGESEAAHPSRLLAPETRNNGNLDASAVDSTASTLGFRPLTSQQQPLPGTGLKQGLDDRSIIANLQAHAQQGREKLLGNRVLIVDDDAMNRRLGMRMLERLGIDVEAVADGQEAMNRVLRGAPPKIKDVFGAKMVVETPSTTTATTTTAANLVSQGMQPSLEILPQILASPTTQNWLTEQAHTLHHHPWNYDALLLDIHLPIMSGDVVCKELRQLGCDIAIIAVTGIAAAEAEPLLSVGFDQVLCKPFFMADLVEKMNGALEMARKRQEAKRHQREGSGRMEEK